jgi:hypothetical protein
MIGRSLCTRSGPLQAGSPEQPHAPASRRVYEYAIDQFIAWYCSEPRLAFNRIEVVRYCMHLESRGLAATYTHCTNASLG